MNNWKGQHNSSILVMNTILISFAKFDLYSNKSKTIIQEHQPEKLFYCLQASFK